MKHYLIALILLSSCSANYHLNQAKRHLKIAEQKGAKITADTVYSTLLIPETKIDTFLNEVTLEKLLRDTIIVKQNNEVIKIKYVPKEKRIYVKSEITKPVYIKVPVAVKQVIKAGLTSWDAVILGIAIALFALGVGYFIGRNRK